MTRVCRFCMRPAHRDTITAGPSLGKVHRACFTDWDRQQEALELEFGRGFNLSDPIAAGTDLEIESDTLSASAA